MSTRLLALCMKKFLNEFLDVFYYDLLDLEKKSNHQEIEEEAFSEENENFQVVAIMLLAFILLLVTNFPK